jgi:LuxR family maltose regulon positive regulatory protein
MGMGDPKETVAVRAAGVVARGALYARLSAGVSAGVTLVSAPPGSGKTVLLRSWIDEAGLRARTAWVLVDRHERDAQRFWLSVVERLRSAVGRDGLMQEFAPAPAFDGEGLVRRLVAELEALEGPVVLVIDDLHELVSPDAQAQLELLLARRPRLLYVVLATRHDPALGLHRLRLAGELTELRAVDLRMSAEEARQLLEASGVELSAKAAAMLLARTEGWAAGLRLATMSLAGHPDPERFVAAFAGSDRTVADYLLAEVLERQREGSSSSCSARRSWSGSAARSPIAWPARAARNGRSSIWRTRTRSSSRSTPSGPGSATTRCSRISCTLSCGAASPIPSPGCTAPRPSGTSSTGS